MRLRRATALPLAVFSAALCFSIVSCGGSKSSTPTPTGNPTPTGSPTPNPTPTGTPPSNPTPPSGGSSPATQAQLTTEVVAENLQEPWSLAFAPDGRLFFTEAPGNLRVISGGTLVSQPVLSIATAGFEGGLTGMDLDKGFSGNGFVYAHYCTTDMMCHVVRIAVMGNTGVLDKTLLSYPVSQFDHTGGRLKVGPDNLIYVTLGDHGNMNSAQDPASWDGKIIRMNLDGTPAAGNPFPQNPFVYSIGHRDPQGLAWDSSGTLYETDHGPTANDEVNIVTAGGNYGWPTCVGSCNNPAFIDPVVNLAPSSPSMPPSGAVFYSGSAIQGWTNSLLIAVLGLDTNPQAHQIRQIIFNTPSGREVAFQQSLFTNQFGRIRDVAVGPDGFVYFSTSNFKQGTKAATNDDRIIRVKPMSG